MPIPRTQNVRLCDGHEWKYYAACKEKCTKCGQTRLTPFWQAVQDGCRDGAKAADKLVADAMEAADEVRPADKHRPPEQAWNKAAYQDGAPEWILTTDHRANPPEDPWADIVGVTPIFTSTVEQDYKRSLEGPPPTWPKPRTGDVR